MTSVAGGHNVNLPLDLELPMFENVLVGVDGDGGGRDAIALARRLGGERSRYQLMNVVSPPVVASGAALWMAASCRYAEDLLERERRETGIDATLATDCGRSPARALHDHAIRAGNDVIVVGASHRNQLLRALLADDAIGTVDGSSCAIAIAPPGYRPPDGPWMTIAVEDDGSVQSSQGDVVDVLTDLSAEVDLLIIGTRGQRRRGRWTNSSTARRLAARTRCPLLILPTDARVATTATGALSAEPHDLSRQAA
jgi:nucleotide-binding universal stress UspA family protein